MPIYEYRCDRGHNFEVMQRMTEDPVTACSTCGAPVQRVFHPVAVHFKGSGFYNTDYGKKKTGAAAAAEGGSGKGESSGKGDSSGKSESSSGSKGESSGSSGGSSSSGSSGGSSSSGSSGGSSSSGSD